MQVILLEKVEKLGTIGDVVSVKPGFARNYLLPQEKALRATKVNLAYFEAQKAQIEKDNDAKRSDAEKLAKKVDGLTVALIRQASEGGQLYGSVTARDIADLVNEEIGSTALSKKNVVLEQNYKALGLYPIKITLHPEVSVEITINIARTVEEAKVQEESGEALVAGADEEADLAVQAVEAVVAEEKAKAAEAEAEEEATAETDAEVETAEGEEEKTETAA